VEGFRVDESRWPIVVVTFPATVTIEEYRQLFNEYDRISARGERVGYVIDMRLFNPFKVNAAVRKQAAQTFDAHRDVLMKVTVCEARALASPLTAGVLTAFDWLTGQKWPCKNFTSMEDAERWVSAMMDRPPQASR